MSVDENRWGCSSAGRAPGSQSGGQVAYDELFRGMVVVGLHNSSDTRLLGVSDLYYKTPKIKKRSIVYLKYKSLHLFTCSMELISVKYYSLKVDINDEYFNSYSFNEDHNNSFLQFF
jgi:hypothetical protein